MTVEDSRKIFTPEIHPPWVVFQERQKLDWLNLQLVKIWPYVDELAKYTYSLQWCGGWIYSSWWRMHEALMIGNASYNTFIVNIGAIIPFNSTIGKVAKVAILAALDDVNSNPHVLGGTKLNISFKDNEYSRFLGIVEGLITLRKHTPDTQLKRSFLSRWRNLTHVKDARRKLVILF